MQKKTSREDDRMQRILERSRNFYDVITTKEKDVKT